MAKQANGEGSIFKQRAYVVTDAAERKATGNMERRETGRWVAAIDLGFVFNERTGKRTRRRKLLVADTKAEANRLLRRALKEQDDGVRLTTDRQLVGDFLDRWLEDSVKPSVRPRTADSYAMHVRLYLKPQLGHVELAKLSPQDVQTMMNTLLRRPRYQGDKRISKPDVKLSPRTVSYARAVLRRALGQALKWGMVHRNVATLVDPPKSVRFESPWLSETDARTLLATVKGDRLEALYTVAIALGLRQGEALGLCWRDVDVEGGTLTIRNTLMRLDGKPTLREPKTSLSRRTIVLPARAAKALAAHHERQEAEREAMANAWLGFADGELVFTTPLGTPLDARNLSRRFKAVLATAKLPAMRWHDLRHSAASIMLANGDTARQVMQTLGHSQISLTLNTYSHVMPESMREAAARMDTALFGAADAD